MFILKSQKFKIAKYKCQIPNTLMEFGIPKLEFYIA